jgi:hypothetical protein
MEYLILLYAKEPLDPRDIIRRFENASGTVNERLAAALGGRLLPVSASLTANNGEAVFTAETKNSKAVAALVVAVEHR